MPIYEYKCQNCGQHTELVQKFSDPPATTCPHCEHESLEKLISAAAFHLKGNGWYVTDFKDKPQPSAEKKQDNPTKKTDNKEIASDTKAKDSKNNGKNSKSD